MLLRKYCLLISSLHVRPSDLIDSTTPSGLASSLQKPALPMTCDGERYHKLSANAVSHPSPKHLPSSGSRFPMIISQIFHAEPYHNHQLYLATCVFMNSVTDLRFQVLSDRTRCWGAQIAELEHDCATVEYSLPHWWCNPAHHLSAHEPDWQHKSRLHALLLWRW